MEIVRLPLGRTPPLDADCLRIKEQGDDSFRLTGTAMCSNEDDNESVTLVGAPLYPSIAEAEEAGLAWANDVGVQRFFVGIGSLSNPLQLTEADLPLQTWRPAIVC